MCLTVDLRVKQRHPKLHGKGQLKTRIFPPRVQVERRADAAVVHVKNSVPGFGEGQKTNVSEKHMMVIDILLLHLNRVFSLSAPTVIPSTIAIVNF